MYFALSLRNRGQQCDVGEKRGHESAALAADVL